MSADLSCEFCELARSDPLSIVDAYCQSRKRFSVLVSRMVYAFVAFVFPAVIKIYEFLEESLELSAVLIDRLDSHYLTHVTASGRIADLTCSAAEEEYRSMSVFLHIHHGDDRDKVSYMQAVCCRVEPDIEFYLFLAEKLSQSFRVGSLFDQSSLNQDIIYIGVLTDIIRN